MAPPLEVRGTPWALKPATPRARARTPGYNGVVRPSARSKIRWQPPLAPAVIVGDLDLIRPVKRAGVDVVAVADGEGPTRYSRHLLSYVPIPSPYFEGDLVDRLEQVSGGGAAKLPLLFQQDRELMTISRHRERLAERYSFVLADHELIVDLVDKGRFQHLAQRLQLPVPPARVVHCSEIVDHEVSGPSIVKPLNRIAAWDEAGMKAKAVEVNSSVELRELGARVGDSFPDLLVQRIVPGSEDRIESYHVYVDETGAIAGEFTGRKIRTYPVRFGYTTSLETTHQPDVADLGREIIRRVGLRGVAKVDFKRDDDGRLWLLEINPRFNLWHNVGAAAGMNLPAIVIADLTGTRRPNATEARPGVTWCSPLRDLRAVRAQRESVFSWIRWSATCDTYSTLSVSDPAPFVRGGLAYVLRRRSSP